MLEKSLRLCSVLLLIASATDGDLFRFDYKYNPTVNGWFKYHLVPANWAEARLRCDLEGAVLASPLNRGLLTAMNEVMANQVHSGIFTGIHATISKGDYYSIEGVPLSKIVINWAPNEPDNFKDSESCLMMLANGTMADVKCSEVFPYMCYKQAFNISITRCGTTDKEYRLDSKTGSCYKFHRIGQTWSRAFMTCAAEGGHLGIINSDEESKVYKELYAKFPDKAIQTRHHGVAFVGLHDWDNNGTWRTVHGQTLNGAGFDKWAEGQPDNWNGEYCGGIFRNGLFNDVRCHLALAFICEKNPNSIMDDHQHYF